MPFYTADWFSSENQSAFSMPEGGNPYGLTESVPISSENANMNTENIPQELQPIPADYDSPAEQQGSLVELMDDTFESTTYEQKTQPIQKRAIVYLPCKKC